MAHSHLLLGAGTIPARIMVRRIGVANLKDALAKNFDEFLAMPTHVMFLCLIYPTAGLVLARLAFGYSILPPLYPLATGFALVGPFAALKLYALSRRREAGLRGPFRSVGAILISQATPTAWRLACAGFSLWFSLLSSP